MKQGEVSSIRNETMLQEHLIPLMIFRTPQTDTRLSHGVVAE